jgi:acyl carrier protein
LSTYTTDISSRLKGIVAKHFALSQDTLTEETSFKEDLRADSLEIVSLLVEIEDEFKIELDDNDAVKIKTIRDAIRFSDEYLNRQRS